MKKSKKLIEILFEVEYAECGSINGKNQLEFGIFNKN